MGKRKEANQVTTYDLTTFGIGCLYIATAIVWALILTGKVVK